jgi:tRNA A37 methylthiotransferase MiaB
LKGICTEEDWEEWKNDITVDFVKDNHFTELRDIEVLRERVQTLDMVQNYVGEYYSKEWIQKNVLMLSDEDIEKMKKEIDGETEEEPEEVPQEVPQEVPPAGGQKHSIDINVKGNNQ